MLWDEFLRDVSNRLHGFLEALVGSLLGCLMNNSMVETQRDVEKEAFAMWLLHVLDELVLVIAEDRRQSLSVMVIKWCCLHPGHWTQYVGQELLRNSEAELRADWEDLLNASVMKAREAPAYKEKRGVPGGGRDGSIKAPLQVRDEHLEHKTVSWMKAIGPVSTPLGVVR